MLNNTTSQKQDLCLFLAGLLILSVIVYIDNHISFDITVIISPNTKQSQYSFRNKTFLCDFRTIHALNFALGINRSSERYILVPCLHDTKTKKNHNV